MSECIADVRASLKCDGVYMMVFVALKPAHKNILRCAIALVVAGVNIQRNNAETYEEIGGPFESDLPDFGLPHEQHCRAYDYESTKEHQDRCATCEETPVLRRLECFD